MLENAGSSESDVNKYSDGDLFEVARCRRLAVPGNADVRARVNFTDA